MTRQNGSPLSRLTLWQWGLLVIVASVFANFLVGLMPAPSGSAAARGQAFGRGIATALGIVCGIVLIVMHFLRRKPSTTSRTTKRKGTSRAARRRPGPPRAR